MNRLPIVGVMGSGKVEWAERATELGRWLAREGVHLLTGGGNGVMTSISRAFFKVPNRKGVVIGVLPGQAGDQSYRPKEGYPNPWVEIPIFTHLPKSGNQGTDPLSRNHINILSSDVVIAMPGGPGTVSEVQLALEYHRPVVAYLHHTDELSGIPPTVPVVKTLRAVQEFIEPHLSRNRP